MRMTIAVLAVGSLLLSGSLVAQEKTEFVLPLGEGEAEEVPGVESALEHPVISDTYALQPGDGFLIAVSGATNFAYSEYVTHEGKVFVRIPLISTAVAPGVPPTAQYEYVGELHVAGLTLRETETKLAEEFLKYYKGVDVSLTLTRFRTFRVFVSGEVFRPGVYTANPITRVSEIVNRAQLKGMASRGNIEVVREDVGEIRVDLYKFELDGDRTVNPYVRDGDVIHIPPMKASVTVKGAVYGSGIYELRISALTAEQTKVSEGIYELEAGESVSQILTKAGGITPWADLSNCYVERFGPNSPERAKLAVDLHKLLIEGDEGIDTELMDGDILVIPSLEEKVYVQGAVNNPGAFLYQPNLRVDEYVGLAGGPTDRANLSRVKVLRADGSNLSGKVNPVVKRGDKIVVPQVTLKWWQDYLAITTAVTSVVIAWLTISK